MATTSESEESESLEDEEEEWEEEEEEESEEGEGGWLASGVGDGREERLGDVSSCGAGVSPGCWWEGGSSGRGAERALLRRLRLASMAEYDSLLVVVVEGDPRRGENVKKKWKARRWGASTL